MQANFEQMFEYSRIFPYHCRMSKNPVTELPDGPADEHGLTSRQLKILSAIKDAVETNGYPPSMREIGHAADPRSDRLVFFVLSGL